MTVKEILTELVVGSLKAMEESLGKAEAGYEEVPVEVNKYIKKVQPLIDKAEERIKAINNE